MSILREKEVFLRNRVWKIRAIVNAACLISFWPVLAVCTLPFRFLFIEAQIPFFFFLIWFIGLTHKSLPAFLIAFLGHFFFDLIFFLNPFFFFLWIASGLISALIAFFKNYWKVLFFLALLLPFFYFLSFFIISLIIFSGSNFWNYFLSFPQTTFVIVFINPFFSFLVYFTFFYNPSLRWLVLSFREKNNER